MTALVVLLRQQWVVDERLLFPMVQVPIAMIGEAGEEEKRGLAPVFRRKALWAGVGVPMVFYSLRALNQYNPAIPEGIPLRWFLTFAKGAVVIPWTFNYAGTGFGYLLSTKLSFSIWVMGALTIAEEVALSTLGVSSGGPLLQLLITLAYQRLPWWPLHPLSFPIGAVWCTHQVMVSMFLAWLTKITVLHYGGVRLYRATRPFFLGLILGHYLAGGWWLVIDGFMGMRENYLFFW